MIVDKIECYHKFQNALIISGCLRRLHGDCLSPFAWRYSGLPFGLGIACNIGPRMLGLVANSKMASSEALSAETSLAPAPSTKEISV